MSEPAPHAALGKWGSGGISSNLHLTCRKGRKNKVSYGSTKGSRDNKKGVNCIKLYYFIRKKMNLCVVSQESSWKCCWGAIARCSFCWPPYTKALPWDCLSACDIAFFFLPNSTVLLSTESLSRSYPNFMDRKKVRSTFRCISAEFHGQFSYS